MGQVMGDGGDDDPGLAAQGAEELPRDAVVQCLVPAVLDDQLGQYRSAYSSTSAGGQRRLAVTCNRQTAASSTPVCCSAP